ncbi:MAG: hypothetical protein IJV15_12365 [Lachnospiraceae bacterium]|nr:hypothetical protein [Lachnospiraceae bacterium]
MNDKKEKNNILAKIGGAFLGLILGGGFIAFIYHNMIIAPSFNYYEDDNSIKYTVNGQFKEVYVTLHPQLIVYFDNKIYYIAYLKNYYSEEQFYINTSDEDSSVIVEYKYCDSANKFCDSLRYELSQKLIDEFEFSQSYVDDNLKIELSTIAGVKYQNNESDKERKICFIQTNGGIKRYSINSKTIKNRMMEDEINLFKNYESSYIQDKEWSYVKI